MDKNEIMEGNVIIKEVVDELQKLQWKISAEIISFEELKKFLSDIINHLITNDFSRLISILYRLDISEEKLKQLLQETINTSAGEIIAEMIIERQTEKMRIRKLFSADDNDYNEEKW